MMKIKIFTGLSLVLSIAAIAEPANAFKYRLLEVDRVEPLCIDEGDDDLELVCIGPIRTSDLAACTGAGGKVGAVGTRPVCVNEAARRNKLDLEFELPLQDETHDLSITAESVRYTEIDHPRYRYYLGLAFRFAGKRLPNEIKRFEETQRIVTRAVDMQNITNAQEKDKNKKGG